jgi:hypothetical protein
MRNGQIDRIAGAGPALVAADLVDDDAPGNGQQPGRADDRPVNLGGDPSAGRKVSWVRSSAVPGSARNATVRQSCQQQDVDAWLSSGPY